MKVLIIGLGSIGQRHLRNLNRKFGDDLEVLAYRRRKRKWAFTDDLKVEEGINVEEKFNIETFDKLDEALEEKPVAAFICTPSNMHVNYAIECAKAGCHLFIEKPLSHSIEGVEELKKIVNKNKLTAFIAYQLRFSPVVKALKDHIEKERIGKLLSVHIDLGEYLPDWHKYEDYKEMYAARSDQGGGVVLTQIHEYDYLYWLFEMPTEIFALGGKLSDLELDVEDTVDALLKFEFRGRVLPVSVHMDYIQKPPVRTCKVIGTNGSIIMDLINTSFLIKDRDGSEKKFEFHNFQRNQMYMDELDHFFDCIMSEKKPLIDLFDAMNSLKIANAVRDSIKSGKIINLR